MEGSYWRRIHTPRCEPSHDSESSRQVGCMALGRESKGKGERGKGECLVWMVEVEVKI